MTEERTSGDFGWYRLRKLVCVRIFFHAIDKKLKIYLLIDEYDNFANTILTTAGQEAYHNLTHGEGFFRYFFNLLKGATAGQISGLTRLYITGVSPVTMDDVTSGFNIGDNLSMDEQFNELVGFTEAEVRGILEHYHQAGALKLTVDECLETMRLWYDGYCFAQEIGADVRWHTHVQLDPGLALCQTGDPRTSRSPES